jgi:hypothetical protein
MGELDTGAFESAQDEGPEATVGLDGVDLGIHVRDVENAALDEVDVEVPGDGPLDARVANARLAPRGGLGR